MPLASLWFDLFNPEYLAASPVMLVATAFQIWMLVDAVRRQEWIWAVCIFFFSVFSALIYYFLVYRPQGPAGGGARGFELPGAGNRRRMRELQSRIHHLDNARDHFDLADLHFRQGKLAKAEAGYRAALERDPGDIDTLAHLGQCLLRQNRPAEARPMLEQVVASDPRHDYGHSLMALAETQTALGEADAALASWRRVLEHNSYARARVQYAELLAARGDRDTARKELEETLADDIHTPTFQRGRDKVWIRRARRLLRTL